MLFAIVILLVIAPLLSASVFSINTPPCVFVTVLFVTVTLSTTDQGALPSWFLAVKTSGTPFCPSSQLFWKRFPSIVTRRAFFNSKWFFIVQWRPRYEGSPTFQVSGLKNRLP